MHSKIPLVVTTAAALVLSACFESDHRNRQVGGGNEPAANQQPTISGSPPPSIREGEAYDFMPTASDPDGHTLEFRINRKPRWASFDRATGRLTGTPDGGDVGSYTNIRITVTDGWASAELPDFDVRVDQIGFGTATLSWMPPTENADGSTLTDLAGFRIYYGRNVSNLTETVVVNNPGLTRFVVENLSQAKWYFSMTSVNSQGVESQRSPTATKTVS
ncbi:MAG: putative Ig domain-containing protein [Steroidobacteraceae bacterium]